MSSASEVDILGRLKPDFLSSVKMIAISKCKTNNRVNKFALLLTTTGEVYAVGDTDNGCLGIGVITKASEPILIERISKVAGMCVCNYKGDAVAYTQQGSVYTWGTNAGHNIPQLVPGLDDIVDARCSGGYYMALSRSGKVYMWRGHSTWFSNDLSPTPQQRTINSPVTAISMYGSYSTTLTTESEIMSWRDNQAQRRINLPETKISKVACGCTYCAVIAQNGKLYCVTNYSGRQVAENAGRFVDILAYGNTFAAATETGQIYTWQDNGEAVCTRYTQLHEVFLGLSEFSISSSCTTEDVNKENENCEKTEEQQPHDRVDNRNEECSEQLNIKGDNIDNQGKQLAVQKKESTQELKEEGNRIDKLKEQLEKQFERFTVLLDNQKEEYNKKLEEKEDRIDNLQKHLENQVERFTELLNSQKEELVKQLKEKEERIDNIQTHIENKMGELCFQEKCLKEKTTKQLKEKKCVITKLQKQMKCQKEEYEKQLENQKKQFEKIINEKDNRLKNYAVQQLSQIERSEIETQVCSQMLDKIYNVADEHVDSHQMNPGHQSCDKLSTVNDTEPNNSVKIFTNIVTVNRNENDQVGRQFCSQPEDNVDVNQDKFENELVASLKEENQTQLKTLIRETRKRQVELLEQQREKLDKHADECRTQHVLLSNEQRQRRTLLEEELRREKETLARECKIKLEEFMQTLTS